MSLEKIEVPDIGDFQDVDVIEVHVAPGDTIAVEDPLITLENDKASLDIPAPQAGTVKEVKIKMGDKVNMGDVILTLATQPAMREPKTTQPRAKEPTAAAPPPTGPPSPQSRSPARPAMMATLISKPTWPYSARGQAATPPHFGPPIWA